MLFDFSIFENGLGRVVLPAVIIFLTVVFANIVRYFLKRGFLNASNLIKVDPTKYTFFSYMIVSLIYILGGSIAVYNIPQLRAISVSFLAGAGVLAVIIGFASQQAFSNIISGLLIVIFKPFGVGDRIRIGDGEPGIVEDITLRHTVVRTFENRRIILPNSVISEQKIENSSIGDERICKFVEFSISYDSNIDKAMSIITEEAEKHPLFLDVRTKEQIKAKEKKVNAKVVGFGDSSVNLRAWVWTKNPQDAFTLNCDLRKSIKERFDKEGIEIPFPYRTIVYKKDIKK